LPKADKIFGPGNAYVAAAKSILAQTPGGAATDLPAGPARSWWSPMTLRIPSLVAIDLLSQAEHDTLAQVVLVARSENFVERVEAAIEALAGAIAAR
jgi:histidinol dehydrogenase